MITMVGAVVGLLVRMRGRVRMYTSMQGARVLGIRIRRRVRPSAAGLLPCRPGLRVVVVELAVTRFAFEFGPRRAGPGLSIGIARLTGALAHRPAWPCVRSDGRTNRQTGGLYMP